MKENHEQGVELVRSDLGEPEVLETKIAPVCCWGYTGVTFTVGTGGINLKATFGETCMGFV